MLNAFLHLLLALVVTVATGLALDGLGAQFRGLRLAGATPALAGSGNSSVVTAGPAPAAVWWRFAQGGCGAGPRQVKRACG
jgi:hypothetical protein